MKRWALSLVTCVALVNVAGACSIPVFRYALEHWRPDPFMVAVFHQGELTDEQIDLLERLAPLRPDGAPAANVMVKAIDVDHETDPSLKQLWELQEAETMPWMAVHAPVRSGPPQRIWGAALNAENVDRLIQSPARQDVAQKLLDGDSVVWTLVESGNASADDAAFQRLSKQLAHLETILRLPEIEEADFGELSVVPEALRLAFSAIRVSRVDPAESQFVNMLLHTAADLSADESDIEPMAFPIFGRGRAFDALIGSDLTEQTIEDACRFLTGSCQCTVKSENPGLDLLMSVDWDQFIQPTTIDDGPPPLVGLQGFGPNDVEREPDQVASADFEATNDESQEPAISSEISTSDRPRDDVQETAAEPSDSREDSISIASAQSVSRTTLLVIGALFLSVVLGTFVVLTRTR